MSPAATAAPNHPPGKSSEPITLSRREKPGLVQSVPMP